MKGNEVKRLNFIMKKDWTQFKSGSVSSWINAYGIQKKLTFVLNNSEINSNSRILDVGCGSGIFSQLLAAYSSNIIGIDIVNRTEIINNCKDNINLSLMSAEKLGFKEKTFDLVIMMEVLEHIPDVDFALKEVYRILKDDGKLIASTPNKLFPFETHKIKIGSMNINEGVPVFPLLPQKLRNRFETARVFTAKGLRKKLYKHVLIIQEIKYFLPSLDGLERGYLAHQPKLLQLIRMIFECIEKSILKYMGMTIIFVAEKVNK